MSDEFHSFWSKKIGWCTKIQDEITIRVNFDEGSVITQVFVYFKNLNQNNKDQCPKFQLVINPFNQLGRSQTTLQLLSSLLQSTWLHNQFLVLSLDKLDIFLQFVLVIMCVGFVCYLLDNHLKHFIRKFFLPKNSTKNPLKIRFIN